MTELIEFVKSLSSVSVLVAIALIGVVGWLGYTYLVGMFCDRRHRMDAENRASETLLMVHQLASSTGELNKALSMHVASEEQILNRISASLEHLERASTQQVTTLGRINAEMIKLNASSPDAILDLNNARLMVTYQWNWCVDVILRAMQSSIENNGFRGHEDQVVGRLHRAWSQAAADARGSLDRLAKFKYPYASLFEDHIWGSFDRVLELAIPLYYRDISGMSLQEAVKEFCSSARALLDTTLHAYFSMVEDIDQGTLYDSTPSGVFAPDHKAQVVALGAKALRSYRPREAGVKPSLFDETTEIRRIKKEMQRREVSRAETEAVRKSDYESSDIQVPRMGALDPNTIIP